MNTERDDVESTTDARESHHRAPTSIVLAGAYPMFRAGLRAALQHAGGFAVVAEAASIEELTVVLKTHPADIVMLHDSAPSDFGLPALRRLAGANLRVPTVLIAALDGVDDIADAVRAGAVGILPPTVDTSLLLRCVGAVAAGRTWIPRATLAAERTAGQVRWVGPRPFGLTERELEIVRAVAEGCSNREIAERLAIKEDTVKHHVSAAFDKTGTFSRVELALFALHHRLDVVGTAASRRD